MTLKLLTGLIGIFLLLAIIPNAVSQGYYYEEPPRLYLYCDYFESYLVWEEDLDEYDYEILEIGPGESLTLSMEGIEHRVYNPDIETLISLDPDYYSHSVFVAFELRFDGDGDGDFEYIVHFNETVISSVYTMEIYPSYTTGELSEMNDGIIEFEINRTDDYHAILDLEVNRYSSYVQIPFDLDTDRDGTGDYSDSDDDNDGHPDSKDEFPKDRKEWKDTDGDGIGDNADLDDNNNGVPDDFELPLVIGILLLPFVIISIIRKRIKKKSSGGKAGGEEEIEPITTSKSGPKNW